MHGCIDAAIGFPRSPSAASLTRLLLDAVLAGPTPSTFASETTLEPQLCCGALLCHTVLGRSRATKQCACQSSFPASRLGSRPRPSTPQTSRVVSWSAPAAGLSASSPRDWFPKMAPCRVLTTVGPILLPVGLFGRLLSLPPLHQALVYRS